MSSMTKTDFEQIAGVIRTAMDTEGTEYVPTIVDDIARGIADHCATRNPMFDRERFFEACGIGETGDTA